MSAPPPEFVDPTTPRPTQVESLAVAVHQGDWMMALEWRWDRASAAEQAIARRRAEALLDAYEDGARGTEAYARIIGEIDWTVEAGGPGRLRAKARKAEQWFTFRERARTPRRSPIASPHT